MQTGAPNPPAEEGATPTESVPLSELPLPMPPNVDDHPLMAATPAAASPSSARCRPSPRPKLSARATAPLAAASAPASSATVPGSKPAVTESKELQDLKALLSGGNSGRRSAPARAEIMAMPVQTAVRTLEQFAEMERIVDAVCDRWRGLGYGAARRQAAADAGALPAIVNAMGIHRDSPSVQETCALAIGNIVAGMDEPGVERKRLAADAGALEAIANALQTHVDVSSVAEYCCFALGNICFAADEAGLARKQRAADACAVSAILSAMRTHSAESAIQEYGSFALGNICRAVGGVEVSPAVPPTRAVLHAATFGSHRATLPCPTGVCAPSALRGDCLCRHSCADAQARVPMRAAVAGRYGRAGQGAQGGGR